MHEEISDYRVAIAFALIKGLAVGAILMGALVALGALWLISRFRRR